MDRSWIESQENTDFEARLEHVLEKASDPGGRELLETFGIGETTISGWRKSRLTPQFSSLARLSLATNVSLNWLAFGDEYEITRVAKSTHEMMTKFCPKCDGENDARYPPRMVFHQRLF